MKKREWNVRKLISELGGVPAIVSGLSRTGVDISQKTVEKWRERGSIPMDRWLDLLDMVRKLEKRTLVIEDFLVRK
jgi:hypothetical protein